MSAARTSALAGLAYFTLVFGLGFVLGTVRRLWLVPRIGVTAAVMLELPVMLSASWLACGWTVRRFAVPPNPFARIVMGAAAFMLVMAGELALSVLVFGRTPAEHLAVLMRTDGLLGLGSQLLFAAFPLLQRGPRRG
ncbi:hypothetical protein [Sandarakinorhabdus sp.]|uniref:hypothetical protein n=1 Tax=Sandarakinorhabdus sp. TaxID=1916663 RepID=UPI00286E5AFF|nr:hypothetical protein [Sandarakinorhabdus sp.]